MLAAVRSATRFSRRKAIASAPFTAKLTFCGMSPPVISAMRAAFSFDTTTPITLACWSSSGPPELPGCTGALIWKFKGLSRRPDSALISPVVSVGPELSRPDSG